MPIPHSKAKSRRQPKAFGLGRRPAPDIRDRNFPLRALLAPPEELVVPEFKHWVPGPVLDQGSKPHCVGFAWKQWLQATPVRTKTGPAPADIYYAAQLIDEWPGTNYDGTSVRAGAKILEQEGRFVEYRWADDLDTLRLWVLTRGPVVLGTDWYISMFDPDKHGYVKLEGSVVGGHAYLCIGYSSYRQAYRCINSWGKGWGQWGRFWVAEADMNMLLSNQGEACAAIEVAV